MKYSIAIFVAFVFFSSRTNAQFVNIPDNNFRSILKSQLPTCFNASNQLDTTCSQINTLTELYIVGSNITNLDGVQYLKSLQKLICQQSQVSNIPQFPKKLKYLDCSYTSIKNLPGLPDSLVTLLCYSDSLNAIPQLPVTLKKLTSGGKKISVLPAIPSGLTYLWCSSSLITGLPALPAGIDTLFLQNNKLTGTLSLPASLKYLDCSQNQLTNLSPLPASLQYLECSNNLLSLMPALPPVLKYLSCGYNQISSLPVLDDSLQVLYCSDNRLTTLPALPSVMNSLSCGANRITSLPSLPDSLKLLATENNQLTSLPALPAELTSLMISNNNITSLPALPKRLSTLRIANNQGLMCLPKLPWSLTLLNYSNTSVNCIPNYPVNCTFFPANSVICSVTNNRHQCQSYPLLTGLVFNDNNNNGVRDSGDVDRKNVKVQLSNGAYGYTNSNGIYNITADSIGSYAVSIIDPPYYNAVPLSYVHNLSAYTETVNDTFALQAVLAKDNLSILLTSITNTARPGFAFTYNIMIENGGTTALSPALELEYDTAKLVYDSSSAAGMVLNGGRLVLNPLNLSAGESKSVIAYFSVKGNAVIGDSLKALASITDSAVTALDSSAVVVSASYDPNDKQSTPEMTPSQVASGNYIDYLIRFQNTGNDTAFNVVVSDTLSNLLQNNVLQMLGTSHLCRTTLQNGTVYFEFLNIQLPDSNVNKIGSNGFIRFRIKPKSSVIAGDTIPNQAKIFFDYNSAVITNTCQTIIKSNAYPLHLLSYRVRLCERNEVVNQWTTANEINTSHFNVQRSNNGKDFTTIGTVKATNAKTYSFIDDRWQMAVDRSEFFVNRQQTMVNSLYYRLEITDKNGSKAYSPMEKINFKSADDKNIYPNPANDFVIVTGNDIRTVSMTDYTGRLLMTKAASDQKSITLQLKGRAKGLYLLRITRVSGQVKTEKLLVE